MSEEVTSADKRWKELCAGVNDRLQSLEDLQEDLHRFQVVLRVTEKTLLEIEQVVTIAYVLILDPNRAKQDLAEVKVSVTKYETRVQHSLVCRSNFVKSGFEPGDL